MLRAQHDEVAQLRNRLATLAARSAAMLSRRLTSGGATSLPGLIGLKVDPGLIRKLSANLAGSVVVTGTNGKTTTSRFIGRMLKEAGRPYLHNQAGSNLLRGIASSLALGSPTPETWGLFEVDEATMPTACTAVQPSVVVVTNLFRDQLDRYGELKRTAEYIRQGLAELPADSTVILNADDPLVASLGDGLPQHVVYFGIEDTSVSRGALPHAADSVTAPDGQLLEYSAVFVGHLGHYSAGTFRRPQPQVQVEQIEFDGIKGTAFGIKSGTETVKITSHLPGLYNVYNAAAAVAAGQALQIPSQALSHAAADTAAAFGRVEEIAVGGKTVWLGLIKNPTGANEIIATLGLDTRPKHLLILINDNFADGRDVSWLWDADFEELLPSLAAVDIGGTRGADMAVRLKYAGLDPSKIRTHGGIAAALKESLAQVNDGETLYVLPTYTAMLELRKVLASAGHLKHYLDQP